jgi:hypothetical protein
MAKSRTIISHPKSKQSMKPGKRQTPSDSRVNQHKSGQVYDSKGKGRYLELPPSGPSNIIVRTGSPLPAPRDVESQK